MTRNNEPDTTVMTIGELARRTGMSVKVLRRLEGMGLIYTVGRSPAGYRLFDEDALWCVEKINTLRSLGLTLAEIRRLGDLYLAQSKRPYLAERLRAARARTDAKLAELEELRRRIDNFEKAHRAKLACRVDGGLAADDPRAGSAAVSP